MRSFSRSGVCTLAVLSLFLSRSVIAHSWVEQLMLIHSNGTFVGTPGFIRGYVPRSTAGFNDGEDDYLLPPDGRQNQSLILPTDPLCRSSQVSPIQSNGNPRLQAPVGSKIALQYQENGHVTLPNNQPGKPPHGGLVYIYGTSSPQDNDTLLDVHRSWTTDGSGGNKKGKLLATQYFDDGQCYQINGGNISVARQAEIKFNATDPMGANLWCQNDIVLPSDAVAGKPYTLYWVWDWPTAAGVDPSLPEGKEEIYTSCMDVDVIAGSSTTQDEEVSSYISGQPVNNAAVSSYVPVLNAGSNILASTPAGDNAAPATQSTTPVATSQTPASTLTIATAPASAPASSATSAVMSYTVYPITTLMTSVLISAGAAATSAPDTVAGTTALSTDVTMAQSTVTITPTVYVTMQPSNAPSVPVSASSVALVESSAASAGSAPSASYAPLTGTSNCTTGAIQKRSKILPRIPHFRRG